MKFVRNLLDLMKVGFVAYICIMLSWGPLATLAQAKITMKPTDKNLKIITIEKGDTLWDLAAKYLGEGKYWPRFKEVNEYTNPDLIYPGEKMQIPIEVAKEIKFDLEKELTEMKSKYDELLEKCGSTSEEIKRLQRTLNSLRNQNKELRETMLGNQEKMDQVKKTLAALEKRVAKSEASAADVQKSVEQTRSANIEQLAQIFSANKKLETRINVLEETMNSKMAEIASKAEELEQLRSNLGTMSGRIDKVEKAVASLEAKIKASEWPYEKPSHKKKVLAFLAALVGAVAWAAASSK